MCNEKFTHFRLMTTRQTHSIRSTILCIVINWMLISFTNIYQFFFEEHFSIPSNGRWRSLKFLCNLSFIFFSSYECPTNGGNFWDYSIYCDAIRLEKCKLISMKIRMNEKKKTRWFFPIIVFRRSMSLNIDQKSQIDLMLIFFFLLLVARSNF